MILRSLMVFTWAYRWSQRTCRVLEHMIVGDLAPNTQPMMRWVAAHGTFSLHQTITNGWRWVELRAPATTSALQAARLVVWVLTQVTPSFCKRLVAVYWVTGQLTKSVESRATMEHHSTAHRIGISMLALEMLLNHATKMERVIHAAGVLIGGKMVLIRHHHQQLLHAKISILLGRQIYSQLYSGLNKDAQAHTLIHTTTWVRHSLVKTMWTVSIQSTTLSNSAPRISHRPSTNSWSEL